MGRKGPGYAHKHSLKDLPIQIYHMMVLTVANTGINMPRLPATLDAFMATGVKYVAIQIYLMMVLTVAKTGINMPRLPATLDAFMATGALSLALLPSRPSCTNNSNNLISNSPCSVSPWMQRDMLAKALLMAKEQCL